MVLVHSDVGRIETRGRRHDLPEFIQWCDLARDADRTRVSSRPPYSSFSPIASISSDPTLQYRDPWTALTCDSGVMRTHCRLRELGRWNDQPIEEQTAHDALKTIGGHGFLYPPLHTWLGNISAYIFCYANDRRCVEHAQRSRLAKRKFQTGCPVRGFHGEPGSPTGFAIHRSSVSRSRSFIARYSSSSMCTLSSSGKVGSTSSRKRFQPIKSSLSATRFNSAARPPRFSTDPVRGDGILPR